MPARTCVLSCFSHVWLWALQAPLSRGFLRQEYWSGLLFPSWGDHPDPGIEHAGGFLSTSAIWEVLWMLVHVFYTQELLCPRPEQPPSSLLSERTALRPGFCHPVCLYCCLRPLYSIPWLFIRCDSLIHVNKFPWFPEEWLITPIFMIWNPIYSAMPNKRQIINVSPFLKGITTVFGKWLGKPFSCRIPQNNSFQPYFPRAQSQG